MKRWIVAAALGCLALVAVGLTPGRAAATASPIQHVVLIMKENRSFDHYFGRFPGANGAVVGTRSDGTTFLLPHAADYLASDIGHSANDFFKAYNNGLNNGFDRERGAIQNGQYVSYGQMHQADIPNYWTYASTYGLGDNVYSDFHGASFANNLYEIAAQAGLYDDSLQNRSVWTIPRGSNVNRYWGCDDPPDTLVTMMSPAGQKSDMFPCFGFRALPNLLSENLVSWGMFTNSEKSQNIHNSLDALTPIRYDTALWSNVRPLTDFIPAVQSGTLPAVSWIIPLYTEHPPQHTCFGENATVKYVNAIMNSQYWNSTAIFVVWDEWGGFYDHVPPPQVDNISYGFRVPLLVISPWTKYGPSSGGGYIGHQFYSHASFIRFVENNWNLGTLGAADATANGYEDFFDFSQVPKAKLILQQRTCPALTAKERWLLAHEDD